MYRSTSDTTSSFGLRRVGEHEVDGLLARPAQRMQAGVHDQPRGTKRLAREHAEAIDIAGIELQLVGETLGVKRPAFGVAGVSEVPAERMNLLPLERDRQLQVMAGNGFVKRRGLGGRAALRLRPIGVDEEHRGAAAVLGRRVVFVRPALLPELRIRLDDDGGLWREAERRGHHRLRAGESGLRIGNQVLAALEQVLLVGAQPLEQFRHIARTERTLADRFHFRVELLDFPHAGGMHVLGGHRQRAVGANRRVVARGAAGIRRHAHGLARGRKILSLQKITIPRERRHDLLAHEQVELLLKLRRLVAHRRRIERRVGQRRRDQRVHLLDRRGGHCLSAPSSRPSAPRADSRSRYRCTPAACSTGRARPSAPRRCRQAEWSRGSHPAPASH